ncbi:NAD(P)H-dependent oxidoreductase [Variovorax sp. E3]|uniref:NAD(P)H-dependent oxidoreductase n=1 Tax=Variovorax sp. E3 TaxID=1914993 RepID=UPI0018DC1490|nr:NAD(P)H-dependent oxidoreductase [Variovorax sp. E3]
MATEQSDSVAPRKPHIVGVAGNWSRPSRTRTLVQAVLESAARRGLASTALLDLVDAGPELGHTTERSKAKPALAAVLQQIQDADALVVGTAVYKGAYTGLFKHLFDLFEMDAFARKPVLLTATGASPAHASVIDYHLRPLFLFFDARVATRGLYGLPHDFEASGALGESFLARLERCVDELAVALAAPAGAPGA